MSYTAPSPTLRKWFAGSTVRKGANRRKAVNRTVYLGAMPSGLRSGFYISLLLLIATALNRLGVDLGPFDLELVLGLIIVLIVWWYLDFTHFRRIRSCASIEQLKERLSLDEEYIARVLATRQIEPHYNIGGKLLYRVEDFSQALSLLRPADGDVELLRAAQSAESVDDILVRPSSGESL